MGFKGHVFNELEDDVLKVFRKGLEKGLYEGPLFF